MIVVHGLKNCDTCRKALGALDAAGVAHRFHDLRRDGLDAVTLDRWVRAVGWEVLLNRRGTTWRGLTEAERAVADAEAAAALMLAHPALVKRPVIETGSDVLVGWTDRVRAAVGAA